MHVGDWVVDFDSYFEISDNLVNVDEDILLGINKSVRITLLNISFEEPIIYRNSEVCLSCSLISYLNGSIVFTDLIFNGGYYIREGAPLCGDGTCEGIEDSVSCPSDCEAPSTGGGGGGSSTPVVVVNETIENMTNITGEYNFRIEPGRFDLNMKKGTYYRKNIRIINDGDLALNIGIDIDGLEEFVFSSVKAIYLDPGEYKDVRFDIYVSNKQPSDVYLGKINFVAYDLKRKSEIVLNVEERAALFDIRTEVLKKYINPGSRVRANISLINMGDLRNFDVVLTYRIL